MPNSPGIIRIPYSGSSTCWKRNIFCEFQSESRTFTAAPLYSCTERFPNAEVLRSFFPHAFGMKLESHKEISFRIVEALDKPVLRVRHGLKPLCQITNPLMVVAVHSYAGPSVPFL